MYKTNDKVLVRITRRALSWQFDLVPATVIRPITPSEYLVHARGRDLIANISMIEPA